MFVQKPNADNKTAQVAENKMSSNNVKNQEQQAVGLNVISENLKTTRSRSSRLSRDLDINPETLSNPNTSYTALLLEDIHNFHQKNTTPPPPAAFSLPPCVTKACSILEAVADLNSSTGSNLSTTDLRRNPNLINDQLKKGKQELRDPILESEVVATDDLMQPSFHKYVTVRRGTADEDLEEQESSGSNSFAGSQQQWTSSSCWEPNSAESTDRWTSSSRSISRHNDVSPVGYQNQRHTASDEGGKRLSAAKKRDGDHQQSGIGRGRIGNRVSHMAPAAVAST